MNTTDINRYFSDAERLSPDGEPGDLNAVFLRTLNELREAYNGPIIMSSGFRSKAYNRKVGGAPSSYHTKGLAADLALPRDPVSRYRLLKCSFYFEFSGRGFYKTFIHVDMRHLAGAQPAYWVK